MRTCATPGCVTRGSRGLFGNFCAPCARNLARIREAFEAETSRYNPTTARAVCRTPGCDQTRPFAEPFCASCRVEAEAA